ncbi:MAG: hypothetical protein QOH12_2124 [Solirubrobacteraceae bacterium]|nr:hypothetical protein [Solirubrobacteraceae bacterium]
MDSLSRTSPVASEPAGELFGGRTVRSVHARRHRSRPRPSGSSAIDGRQPAPPLSPSSRCRGLSDDQPGDRASASARPHRAAGPCALRFRPRLGVGALEPLIYEVALIVGWTTIRRDFRGFADAAGPARVALLSAAILLGACRSGRHLAPLAQATSRAVQVGGRASRCGRSWVAGTLYSTISPSGRRS